MQSSLRQILLPLHETKEVILALDSTIEGDTTSIKSDDGDFGMLREISPLSLFSGATLLTSVCALGLFATLKVWRS